MARRHAFLLDEHISERVARKLRRLGHSAIRVRSKRRASIPDEDVVVLAQTLGRAIITRNKKDFLAFHQAGIRHEGMFLCAGDEEQAMAAQKIHDIVKDRVHLTQQVFHVTG